jgi:hypothetical protein
MKFLKFFKTNKNSQDKLNTDILWKKLDLVEDLLQEYIDKFNLEIKSGPFDINQWRYLVSEEENCIHILVFSSIECVSEIGDTFENRLTKYNINVIREKIPRFPNSPEVMFYSIPLPFLEHENNKIRYSDSGDALIIFKIT